MFQPEAAGSSEAPWLLSSSGSRTREGSFRRFGCSRVASGNGNLKQGDVRNRRIFHFIFPFMGNCVLMFGKSTVL